MKKIYLILFLFCGVAISNAQNANIKTAESNVSISDEAQVLQKCLDFPGIQQYFPKDADGSFLQANILQVPTAFNPSIEVTKFDQPINFMGRSFVSNHEADAFLIFKEFTVVEAKASVVFDLFYNYKTTPAAYTVTVELIKSGADWNYASKSMTELTITN